MIVILLMVKESFLILRQQGTNGHLTSILFFKRNIPVTVAHGNSLSIIYKFQKDSFPNLLKLAAVALTLPFILQTVKGGLACKTT